MKKAILVGASLLPALVFAQSLEAGVATIGRIMNAIVPIVVTLAIIYFFYGLAKYILSAGDPTKAKDGKSIMIFGVIALFVMFSVWGLIRLIGNTFGIGTGGTIQIPRIQ